MNEQFWIQIAIYILTGLLAVARVGYIVGKIEAKCATKEELEKAKAEGDEKRARIYARFDEYKAHLESNFIRREVCGLMHNETAKSVTRMADELHSVKEELSEVKAIVIKLQVERK